MPLLVTRNFDLPAVRENDIPLRNRRGGVVRPLAVNIRPEAPQHRRDGATAEKEHGINPANGCNEEGAVSAGHHRAAGPTQAASGTIIVDGDDEKIAQMTGRLQIPQVSDMQQIEDAIREDDPQAASASP